MKTKPLNCKVIVSNNKELYNLETLLFKYNIHWIGYKVGKRYSLSGYFEKGSRYIHIDKNVLTHGCVGYITSSSEDIYEYKDFMKKYEKVNNKPIVLNDSLYKRKKPFLRQNR